MPSCGKRGERMICPWLKSTTSYKSSIRDETYEEYCGCYGDECPWFRPNPDGTSSEPECLRMVMEYNRAKGGNNNGKD